MDCFPSPLRPTRWETWGPSQQINTVVDVPNLLMRGPVPHEFHGGLVCLQVRSPYTAPAALVDEPFYLFLPSLGGMQEHLMQDDRSMGCPKLPQGVLIEE